MTLIFQRYPLSIENTILVTTNRVFQILLLGGLDQSWFKRLLKPLVIKTWKEIDLWNRECKTVKQRACSSY